MFYRNFYKPLLLPRVVFWMIILDNIHDNREVELWQYMT